MAVRVRKLARQTGRSAEHLLGVLAALGYRRYRSPEDMLADDVCAKLRRALREGVKPEVAPDEGATPASQGPSEIERLAQGDPNLMGGVMRHVEPLDHKPRKSRPPQERASEHPSGGSPSRRPIPPSEEPVTGSTVAAGGWAEEAVREQQAVLDSRTRTLEHARRRMDEQRRQLDVERERVEALRLSVAREREALDARRSRLDELERALEEEHELLADERGTHREPSQASLVSLLEARGLRGVDEFERAIVGLAKVRRLQDVLLTLGTDQPRAIRRLLSNHVVLTGPNPPAAMLERSDALVRVAPDRAEVPDAAELKRLGDKLSDVLLLAGLRAMRLVGGRPVLARLLQEHLDDRISFSWAPGVPRSEAGARDDVAQVDLVVLWNVEEEPAARSLYDAARPEVLRSSAESLARLVQDVVIR